MSEKLITSTLKRNEALSDWDRIIIGIDPGTNVMGYGILGVRHGKPGVIAMGVIQLNRFDRDFWSSICPTKWRSKLRSMEKMCSRC